MGYGDNVLKNFTTSCSVILGTIISVFLFDFHLTAQFAWGATLVMFSAYIYGRAALPSIAGTASSIASPSWTASLMRTRHGERLRTTSRSLAEHRKERSARRLTRATSSSTRPNCSASRYDAAW